MQKLPVALLLAACTILASCKSNESKPEEAATPAPTAATKTQAAPAATTTKPECAPEPAAKKGTKTTKKAAKKGDPAPADCEPAKPKSDQVANARTIETKPGAAAAPAAAAGAGNVKTGTACNPCTVKSRDGTFDGEVYGNIPANSKWAQLKIGMHQSEVERILGVTSNIRAYVTAKAWIPFYFGNDSHRYEAVYAGQGSVAYTGGGMGGGQGTLMMINFDSKIQ